MSDNPRPSRHPGGFGRGMAPGEKAKDFKGTIRKILKYIGRYKIAVIIVMILSLIHI